MSNESGIPGFGAVEMDAIGEIQNITMGSAATAVSNLLNAKVWITTPRVNIVPADELIFPDLEPSVRVKINYIKGVSGSSIMVLKQSDVQLILAQLMGQPLVVTDDFEFDEMNISAVCEVMNQMMGASATAL
ncbi:MAG TPA: chemotaxis protein CheC, partial [Oscillospiraceae bacterium]|nr:chemotaxis protein CheC [Oscillospiraceae bacterium]